MDLGNTIRSIGRVRHHRLPLLRWFKEWNEPGDRVQVHESHGDMILEYLRVVFHSGAQDSENGHYKTTRSTQH